MPEARFLVGGALNRLAEISDGSVDLVVTSPPFLALRSYLPDDDPDKGEEIGQEPTPAEFVDALLDVTEALDRVVAPHGSICVELGDTYSGSGGAGGDYDPEGLRAGQPKFRARGGPGWPLAKSLACIPGVYESSLAYGRNLLRPERETAPWRVRNLITWLRPNPPVGALGDKVRPASSFIVVACKSTSRWFDLDAVRSALTDPADRRHSTAQHNPSLGWKNNNAVIRQNPHGAPPLDWHSDLDGGVGTLILATQPYRGAHYATFPEALPLRLIEAMCPRRVCRVCGEPSRRIVKTDPSPYSPEDRRQGADGLSVRPNGTTHMGVERKAQTLGWTDCGHDDWRPGVVLDPFCGSGTTLAVAVGAGRDAIGIDLDARNVELARDRCGMFLGVD